MKTAVFLCCTYYQLIVALQMKKTLFKSYNVVICMTDDSNNSKNVFERLKNIKGYENSIYFERKKIINESKSKLTILINSLWGCKKIADILNFKADIFLYYNEDFFTYWIFATLLNINRNLETAIFEESFISNSDFAGVRNKLQHKGFRMLCKIFRRKYIFDTVNSFYSFNPKLYTGAMDVIQIPQIDHNDNFFISELSSIFGVDEKNLKYEEKYIYFTSKLDDIGVPKSCEVELVKKIASIVGIDNLLVKVHPRDDSERYKEAMVKVDENSAVPFEVIQLLHNFSQNVFLTSLSSAVFTVNAISDIQTPILFFYRTISADSFDYKNAINATDELIERVKVNGILHNVVVFSNLEDFRGM